MLKNKNISVLDKFVKTEQIADSKSLSTKNATLLLEGPKEHLEILHQVGLTHHLDINKNKINEKNSVEMLSQIYGGKVFKGTDLESVCNLYDLKLVVARDHKGLLGTEIAKKIQLFVDNNMVEVNDRKDAEKVIKKSKIDLSYINFFILAPSEEFLSTQSKSTACTLFYRESYDGADFYAKQSDKFIEVFSWGNSYSSARTLNHMFNTYEYTNTGDDIMVRSVVIINSVILFLLFLLGIFTSYFTATVWLSIVPLAIIFFNSINKNITHYKKWNVPNF